MLILSIAEPDFVFSAKSSALALSDSVEFISISAE